MKQNYGLVILLAVLPLVVLSGLKTGDVMRHKRTTGESIAIPEIHRECQISQVKIFAQEKYNLSKYEKNTVWWIAVIVYHETDEFSVGWNEPIDVLKCPGLPQPSWTITGSCAKKDECDGAFVVGDPSWPWSGYFTGPPGKYTLNVVAGKPAPSKTVTVKRK